MSVQLLHELVLSGVDATRRLGAMLAESFPPQAVIGLNGTLGAGKTFLARSIAEAIGVAPSEATSPTFTLIQAYRNSGKTVYHIDAYRVADVDEFLDLGVEELARKTDWRVLMAQAKGTRDRLKAGRGREVSP